MIQITIQCCITAPVAQPAENQPLETLSNNEKSSQVQKSEENKPKLEVNQNKIEETSTSESVNQPDKKEALNHPDGVPLFTLRLDGTRFFRGSNVDEKAIIGKNVYVGINAKVGNAIIGDNVKICDDSKIADGLNIPANTFVLDEQTTSDLIFIIQAVEPNITGDKNTLDLEIESILQNENE